MTRYTLTPGSLRITFTATALIAGAVLPGAVHAQSLTVERIFSSELSAVSPGIEFLPDGRRMSSLVRNGSLLDVWVERIGGPVERAIDGTTLIPPDSVGPIDIEGVSWSADGSRALIFTNSQRVWRLNTKGTYYVYDLRNGRLAPVSTVAGAQQFAKFSPDGAQVAFVRDNDLFVADPFAAREVRLTSDGGEDIINGTTDWVYEEELDLRDAFRWSPDGTRIAFWRFDQSPIRPFYMIDELDLYPRLIPIRYPKAGTPNSRVELRVVDIASGRVTRIETGGYPDVYLARMEWIDGDELVIQRLSREQDRIDVLIADAGTGRARPIFAEADSAWVDIDNDLTWIRRGTQFLWTSERDGHNHIYLFNRDGSIARQLTAGPWDVLDFVGVNEAAGRVFFTASEQGPLEKHLYSVALDGRGLRRISQESGQHQIRLAPGGRYYIDTYSRAGVPPITRLHSGDGSLVRILGDNAEMTGTLESLDLAAPEFFQMNTSDGVTLNGWIIKPPDFDPDHRYPVLMYVYGGPGSQTVTDSWWGSRYLWHQLLAQRGIIVASVDNRGTGARGRNFRKVTFRRLGHRESLDQIEAARYLGSLPFVDPDRIGIWGWSYGGFMTALTMMNGDLFRAGIAVAPVTDWSLYDTIYTERFMRSPADNPAGYAENSPARKAASLSGRLFLIHGTGDDNVHFQNTVQLANALQAAGRQFDMMLYANRTHSISGGNTSIHLFNSMTDWLMRYLVGGSAPAS